jgi:hypothetical protein
MNMTATLTPNMLHSIVEQAITLPAPLRLLLGDQETRIENQYVSGKLSEYSQEIKAIQLSSFNLKRRVERIKVAQFTVHEELELDRAYKEVVLISTRLRDSFKALCRNHFWLTLKINKINKRLEDIEVNMSVTYTHLKRFFTGTQWQYQVATALLQPDWKTQLEHNRIEFSANDWNAFEQALEEEPVLTPAQLKAQQRFLAQS